MVSYDGVKLGLSNTIFGREFIKSKIHCVKVDFMQLYPIPTTGGISHGYRH